MTVSEAVPETSSVSAVIVVEPAFFAVANPDELMVATVVLLLVQIKVLPLIFLLAESRAVAENRSVSPFSIDGVAGDTVTRCTTGGGGGGFTTVAVKSWVAVRPSGSLAVTMILPVEPAATGATVTVLPDMLTSAIRGFGEFTV